MQAPVLVAFEAVVVGIAVSDRGVLDVKLVLSGLVLVIVVVLEVMLATVCVLDVVLDFNKVVVALARPDVVAGPVVIVALLAVPVA